MISETTLIRGICQAVIDDRLDGWRRPSTERDGSESQAGADSWMTR
jgi:hypothetical protein